MTTDSLRGAATPTRAASVPLPDPSTNFVEAFRAAAQRLDGLPICNPALRVEAVGFAPWGDHWLGVVLTPWFMNLVLTPRNPGAWHHLPPGESRRYRFPAGDYEFIAARDPIAGEFQLCSLFSPVLEFEDQATAVLVAKLAREALFDAANAEVPAMPVANLGDRARVDEALPGPVARYEKRLERPMSKRDFLRARAPGDGDAERG